MADVQESYPLPTTGLLYPVKLGLVGSGVTCIKGNVYQVTLSLTGTTSVSVTAAGRDIADATANPAYAGAYNWISRNGLPSAVSLAFWNPNDVQESYPVPKSTMGDVAHVSGNTGNPITVTADHQGEAYIEVYTPYASVAGTPLYPVGQGTGNQSRADASTSPANYSLGGAAYAVLIVTVVP